MKGRLMLSTAILLALAAVGAHPAAGAAKAVAPQLKTAQIDVRADDVLGDINPLLFGQNYGPWMNTTDEYVALYRDAGVTLLRFPAGNWGDENDLFPNNMDDLAALAQALDAEVAVHARCWRKGTPEKAAELVRYSNVEKGYAFRYWEVGNEPDLYVKRNNRSSDPVFDVDWYSVRFREFATAMKAVDPDVRIVGPVVTGGWREWMPAFLAANGDIVDVISWHWYSHGNELSDAEALATPVEIEEQIETIRAWWQDPEINPQGYQRPVPPLFLSEYSISWASGIRRHLGTQVGALWDAEVVGRLANAGLEMASHFSLQGSPGGTRWHGLIGPLEDPRPVYGVYRLYTRWGTKQVAVESSEESLLPAFASLRDDGSLAVIVINKDPDRAQDATLNIEGFRAGGQAQIWLQDEAHPTAEGLPAIAVGNTFSYSFQPYSVTLFVVEPAPSLAWFLWVGLGVLAVALAVLGCHLWRPR